MRIGFVFTNYNNSHFTVGLLKSLENLNNPDIYVVIVDNYSNAENVELLKNCNSNIKNIFILFNDENLGYFEGLNIGIAYLKDNFYDINHIVVGNNDLEFPFDFVEQMKLNLNIFTKYPIVSPDIITIDGIHQNPHVIKKISIIRELIYDLYYSNFFISKIIIKIASLTERITDRKDEQSYNISQEIQQGYGACYILGPRFFTNFTKLWAPTFLMGEEFFLSIQLKEKGYKIFYEPNIKVKHKDHGSVSTLPSKEFWNISKKSHKVYRQYCPIFKKKENGN